MSERPALLNMEVSLETAGTLDLNKHVIRGTKRRHWAHEAEVGLFRDKDVPKLYIRDPSVQNKIRYKTRVTF